MGKHKSDIFLGWIAAIAVAIIWGVTGVVSKPLTMAVDSMTLTFFRYTTAVGGLLVIFLFTSRIDSFKTELGTSLKIRKKDILFIAFTGIIGQGCFSFFNFMSLLHIGATENGVIQGLQPFATVAFGMMFMGFRMNKIQWSAFVLSMICVTIMSLGPTSDESNPDAWLGYVYVILSMLSLAWTSHLRNILSSRYGSVVSMMYQYIAVAVVGFALVPVLELDLSQIYIILDSPLLIFLLVFLGTGISGLSYVIQLYAFKRIGVEDGSMALNLMPLISYIVSVVTLGESVTMLKTVVVIIICIALYVFSKYENKSSQESKT